MILRVALPTPLRQLFDYLLPTHVAITPQIGMRVQVPFNRRELIGIIVEIAEQSLVPSQQLKPIVAILDEEPIIVSSMMQLCRWASDYYQHSLGDVLATALPNRLRQGKTLQQRASKPRSEKKMNWIESTTIQLNPDQQIAVDTINQSIDQFKVFLLYGVTGSGKTEVYFQLIEQQLLANKQTLVLIPEIGLTPQTLARFQNRFGVSIAVIHSGLSDGQRCKAWNQAQLNEIHILIGTRSAIFTPMPNLGLIILDEEHDLSFKQQDNFRYSARDLAIVRGQLLQIPIILGSATPSLESLNNVKRQRYTLLELPQRAGIASLPKYHVIDIRNQKLQGGISNKLIHAIEEHLQQNNQVLLFINRRGYAPVLMCHGCGWTADCRQCDSKLTLHQSPAYLQCHHCGLTETIPEICPECKQAQLIKLGVGTERLASTLAELFPDIEILRIDRDSTRVKGSLSAMLEKIQIGGPKILIGTQMLAKGHHFPNVTLVGIINVDSGFYSSDFRACERTAQLILQVSGRAGRAAKPGTVYIQTHHPDYPLLRQLLELGYLEFAKNLLKERELTQLPPFSHHALLRADSRQQNQAQIFLDKIKENLEDFGNTHLQVIGPILAPIAKRAGYYRYLLLLQSTHRPFLHDSLKKLLQKINKDHKNLSVKWSLDVDPCEMM